MIDIYKLEKKFSSDFTLKIDELHINDGERVALIGENGSGKSTLLRLIAGILRPDSGRIETGAVKIGYQPQEPFVFRGSVEKNICLGMHGNTDIDALAEEFGLTGLKHKSARKISGGEKQRMCLARLLAGDYNILALDEPLSAADVQNSLKLENILVKKVTDMGATLIISTHLPSQAMNVATKILIMDNGSVAEYSDVSALKEPESDFGKSFIGRWRL